MIHLDIVLRHMKGIDLFDPRDESVTWKIRNNSDGGGEFIVPGSWAHADPLPTPAEIAAATPAAQAAWDEALLVRAAQQAAAEAQEAEPE